MQTSFYPDKIMSYLQNPVNTGELPVDNKTIFMAEYGSIEKSLKIKVFIEINNAIINKFRYLVYGDGYTIAILSRLSEDLINKKISSLLNFSVTQLASELEIPNEKLAKFKVIRNCLEEIYKQYSGC